MKILYNLAVHLIAAASYFRKKSKNHFEERLGIGFPEISKGDRPLIWIHAVSVGETKAVAPLVKKLKNLPSRPLILITNGTATGVEEAKRVLPEADWHLFLPFDLSYRIRPLVNQICPDLLILAETDYWHHFEDAVKKNGGSVVVVNGKLSERSFRRHLKFGAFSRLLFDPIDLFCVQSQLYADRFMKAGVPEHKIVVTGNIKLDGLAGPTSGQEWKKNLCIEDGDLVFTCGSTHDPEEKILLKTVENLWKTHPRLKLILVPRHPERFETVAKLLQQAEIPFSRFSKKETLASNQVLLVDAMGVLRQCYQVSDVAFVGGSMTQKVGGHNILEPAFYGIPVLYGPYMHSQPDFVDLMQAYHAGIQVSSDSLVATLDRLIKHPHKRKELGQNGLKLVQEANGALDTTYRSILQYLPLAVKSRSY